MKEIGEKINIGVSNNVSDLCPAAPSLVSTGVDPNSHFTYFVLNAPVSNNFSVLKRKLLKLDFYTNTK